MFFSKHCIHTSNKRARRLENGCFQGTGLARGQGAVISCCKPTHSVGLSLPSAPRARFGAMAPSISAAHSSLRALSPPRCPRTLTGRTGSSIDFLTEELGVAATPRRHQNPRAVDSQCLLELCGP